MAIDFSQVTAITIPEGSVSQITDSSSNVLWSSGPSLGKYVLQGAITGSSSSFAIYDTVAGTQLWGGSVSTSIQSMGSGKYKVRYTDFIQQALQNIGAYVNNTNITNLYLMSSFSVKMSSTNLRYLKAINYDNNIVFETTAKGTSWGSTNVTISWNDTNIISDYWDLDNTGGIEDISCHNKTIDILNNYFTQIECYTTSAYTTTSTNLQGINSIGVLVFFDIA